MIQENEIRVGNYYHHNDNWNGLNHKGIFKWTSDDWYWLGEWTIDLENITPIPITEEIILKCGFVRDGNTDYYTCRKVGFTINLSGTIGYRTCIWSDEHIKHLHQLQNLYFALTGEELEINL